MANQNDRFIDEVTEDLRRDRLFLMLRRYGWIAVALILAHYIVAGRWLKGVDQGRALPSGRALRLFNEVPVVLLVGVIWLVLAKPF